MSHTVTVTRTTTTTTTSAVLLNVGYFKTIPGLLKLLHVMLGIVCVALAGHYIAYHRNQYTYRLGAPAYAPAVDHAIFLSELYFLLMTVTCLIASTLLLFSCIISIATATIIPKTVFEIVYHFAGFWMLLVASGVYIGYIETEYRERYKGQNSAYAGRLAASEVILCSTLTFLLLVSACHYMRVVVESVPVDHPSVTAPGYGAKIFAGIIGLVNSALYAVATFFAYRSFRAA